MRRTRIDGFANDAFFPARSVSRTPRALDQAPQTWIGMPSATVARSVSASGGQPTGTTAFATGSRISETASPRRKICASWPASTSALACRNGNAALVGSSDPHALFTRTLMLSRPLAMVSDGGPGDADPGGHRCPARRIGSAAGHLVLYDRGPDPGGA